MAWIIALCVVAGILLLMGIIVLIKKRKAKQTEEKKKQKKEKRERRVQKKEHKREEKLAKLDAMKKKGAYCDTVEKFLYRKEIKIFILINRILPKGYIIFPKIGLDTILEPIGDHSLFDSIKGKHVDFVIFKQETMKPLAVVDIYDGTIDDEQLDANCPEIVEALKSAELPIVSFKVKSDYAESEIKNPIYNALQLPLEETKPE